MGDATQPALDLNVAPPPAEQRHSLDPDWITPVDCFGGVWVKREDLFGTSEVGGAKLRALLVAEKWVDSPTARFVAAASAHTAMQVYAAAAAELTGRRATIISSARRELTPSTRWSLGKPGVEYEFIRPGYLSQLNAVARRLRDKLGAGEVIPFSRAAALEQTAAQVANVVTLEPKRVIVPTGSGLTLLGVITGFTRAGANPAVVKGYALGSKAWPRRALADVDIDPDAHLLAIPHGYRPSLALEGCPLDTGYARRLGGLVTPGDLLWNVGASEPRTARR